MPKPITFDDDVVDDGIVDVVIVATVVVVDDDDDCCCCCIDFTEDIDVFDCVVNDALTDASDFYKK